MSSSFPARTNVVSAPTSTMTNDLNNPTKRRNITDFYQKSSISSSAPDKNLTTDNNQQSRVDLDETFIVGTSRDKSLRIRIEKSDLTHLTQTQLQHIARDPVDFLTTSSAALLHVFKGITRQTGDSKVEEHFHNTNSNGFCFADVLRQNRYRHCKEVLKKHKMPKPTDLFIPDQRAKLKRFIEKVILVSATPDNPDRSRLKVMIKALESEDINALNSTQYAGLENIHKYTFDFDNTCWSNTGVDEDFMSLVWTNVLGSSRNFLGCHAISVEEFRIVVLSANHFHHDKEHFYIVPIDKEWCATKVVLLEILESISGHIQNIVNPLIIQSSLASYEVSKIKSTSPSGMICLELSQQFYQVFDNMSQQDILNSLTYSSTQMISLFKQTQTQHRQSSVESNGHDMFLSLVKSQHQSKFTGTSNNSGSNELFPIGNQVPKQQYLTWLQYQSMKNPTAKINSTLQLSIARINTSMVRNMTPLPEQIEELLIEWRCSMWSQSQTNYSSVVWTNKLSKHYKVTCRENLFSTSQLRVILNTANDVEYSNGLYYLIPQQESETLRKEFEQALENLAQNIFNIQNRIKLDTHSSNQSSSSRLPPSPLDAILSTDKYFMKDESKETLVAFLQTGSNIDARIFPSQLLRNKLEYLLESTTVDESSVCGDKGLFVSDKRAIRKGEVIGIYGGKAQSASRTNAYTFNIEEGYDVGAVPTDDPWTKCGYINEYIWDRAKCNCEHRENGLIVALRPIKSGEELFMSYGVKYDWSDLVNCYKASSLVDALVEMAKFFPEDSAPVESLIRDTYMNLLQDPEQKPFHYLLFAFFCGTRLDPDGDIEVHFHLYQPFYIPGGNVSNWIIMMLTSRWFYEQQCFREHCQPNQILQGFISLPIDKYSTHSATMRPRPAKRITEATKHQKQFCLKEVERAIIPPIFLQMASNSKNDHLKALSDSTQNKSSELNDTSRSETPSSVKFNNRMTTSASPSVFIDYSDRSQTAIPESEIRSVQLNSSQQSPTESLPQPLDPVNLVGNQSDKKSTTEEPSVSNHSEMINSSLESSYEAGYQSTTTSPSFESPYLTYHQSTVNSKELDPAPFTTEQNDSSTQSFDYDRVADHLCSPSYRTKPHTHLFSTLFVNVGTPHEGKRVAIFKEIFDRAIDVSILMDVGVTSSNLSAFKRHTENNLSKSFLVHFITTVTNDSGTSIGGAIIIISKRLQQIKVESLVSLGSLIKVNIKFGLEYIMILGLYFPRLNVNDGSFLSAISKSEHINIHSVQSHIHEQIDIAIRSSQLEYQSVILSGDFNVNIHSAKNNEFQYLYDELELSHAANDEELKEFSYQQGELGSISRRTTRIDFTLFNSLRLIPTSCKCLDLEAFWNDHLPVLSTFNVRGQSAHLYPQMTKPGSVRYDWSNYNERKLVESKLRHGLDKLIELPFKQRLDSIAEETVKIVAKVNPPKKPDRGSHPNDWCPENKVLGITRDFLIRINRHVNGYKKFTLWKEGEHKNRLKNSVKQLLHDIKKISKTDEEYDKLCSMVPRGNKFWIGLSVEEMKTLLPEVIVEVHKMSSNRIKRQRREDFEQFSRHREYLFQIQRIGAPIRSVILKNNRHRYLMEDIMHEGERITRPGVLFTALTHNFQEWFKANESISTSTDFLYDHDSFMQYTLSQNIPHNEASILWNAISKRPTVSRKLKYFQQECVVCPSFEEYMFQVNSASVNSAGGMSGLTYSMMRSWPHHIHVTVYEALRETWEQKDIPESWKWRWLLPLPKVPDPSISQLRPLCLLEVLRKLWSKIFVKRISKFVEEQQILDQSQHSGRGKGTESGVLELAASLETAKEMKSNIFISSWDIRRAYDSVQRKFLLFAWIRIGVPIELALYLVSMDYEAKMVIKAPLAIATFDTWGLDGLQKLEMDFFPEQGTAQGGVDSSLVFTAFLDILLCAISSQDDVKSNFALSDIDGNIQSAEPIAYVDDLICITGTAKRLQDVANIVSSFCIIFNLTLNTEKFRAFAIMWGNPHSCNMEEMLIHTEGWSPVVVPMLHDGTMTHLGVTWDMSLDNDGMFSKTLSLIRKYLNFIIKSKASLEIKMCVIKISLMPTLIYETKFSTWSLQQFQQFDTLFQIAFRKITYNLPSFPSRLLYGAKYKIGLDLPQYSTEVQLAKFHMFQRSTYGLNPRRQFIINSLTSRVIRQMGCQPARYGPYKFTTLDNKLIPSDINHSWWFSSLAQHMTEHLVSLERSSLTEVPLPLHFDSVTREKFLHCEGITTAAELLMIGDDRTTVSQEIIDLIPPSPMGPIPIRQGQVWSKHNHSSNTWEIIEIMGFIQENQIIYAEWSIETYSSNQKPKLVLLRDGSNQLLGCGAVNKIEFQSFFNPIQASFYLTSLSAEKYLITGNRSSCIKFLERQPFMPMVNLSIQSHSWFKDVQSEIIIHTESKPIKTSLITSLSTTTIQSTSYLVKTIGNSKKVMIIHHDNTTDEPALTNKVIALYIAGSLANQTRQTFIATEPLGISLNRRSTSRPAAHNLSPLLVPSKASRMFPFPVSSPEQKHDLACVKHNRITNCQASMADHGHLSRLFIQQVIHHPLATVLKHHPGTTVTYVEDSTFLQNIRIHRNGCFIYNNKPLIKPYKALIIDYQHQQYLTKRDSYRQQFYNSINRVNECQTYWQHSSVDIASIILNKVKINSSRAFITRVVYDWHLTGRNKLKQTPTDDEVSSCMLCNHPLEDQQHIIWKCNHPDMKKCRQYYKGHIDSIVQQFPETKSTKNLVSFHNIISNPENWELTIGRIHEKHARLMSKFESSMKTQIINHSKRYFNMVMSLYSIRQQIINLINKTDSSSTESEPTPPVINITEAEIEQMRARNGETLLGITKECFVDDTGAKITSNNLTPEAKTTVSKKRKSLTKINSIFLRLEDTQKNRRNDIEVSRENKELEKKITQEDRTQYFHKYFEEDMLKEYERKHPFNLEAEKADYEVRAKTCNDAIDKAIKEHEEGTYYHYAIGTYYPPFRSSRDPPVKETRTLKHFDENNGRGRDVYCRDEELVFGSKRPPHLPPINPNIGPHNNHYTNKQIFLNGPHEPLQSNIQIFIRGVELIEDILPKRRKEQTDGYFYEDLLPGELDDRYNNDTDNKNNNNNNHEVTNNNNNRRKNNNNDDNNNNNNDNKSYDNNYMNDNDNNSNSNFHPIESSNHSYYHNKNENDNNRHNSNKQNSNRTYNTDSRNNNGNNSTSNKPDNDINNRTNDNYNSDNEDNDNNNRTNDNYKSDNENERKIKHLNSHRHRYNHTSNSTNNQYDNDNDDHHHNSNHHDSSSSYNQKSYQNTNNHSLNTKPNHSLSRSSTSTASHYYGSVWEDNQCATNACSLALVCASLNKSILLSSSSAFRQQLREVITEILDDNLSRQVWAENTEELARQVYNSGRSPPLTRGTLISCEQVWRKLVKFPAHTLTTMTYFKCSNNHFSEKAINHDVLIPNQGITTVRTHTLVQSLQINILPASRTIRQQTMCHRCQQPNIKIHGKITSYPDILTISIEYENSAQRFQNKYIEERLIIENERYNINSVIYYGLSHFRTRTIINNTTYDYDGMKNQGRLQISPSTNTINQRFPYATDCDYRANFLIYLKEANDDNPSNNNNNNNTNHNSLNNSVRNNTHTSYNLNSNYPHNDTNNHNNSSSNHNKNNNTSSSNNHQNSDRNNNIPNNTEHPYSNNEYDNNNTQNSKHDTNNSKSDSVDKLADINNDQEDINNNNKKRNNKSAATSNNKSEPNNHKVSTINKMIKCTPLLNASLTTYKSSNADTNNLIMNKHKTKITSKRTRKQVKNNIFKTRNIEEYFPSTDHISIRIEDQQSNSIQSNENNNSNNYDNSNSNNNNNYSNNDSNENHQPRSNQTNENKNSNNNDNNDNNNSNNTNNDSENNNESNEDHQLSSIQMNENDNNNNENNNSNHNVNNNQMNNEIIHTQDNKTVNKFYADNDNYNDNDNSSDSDDNSNSYNNVHNRQVHQENNNSNKSKRKGNFTVVKRKRYKRDTLEVKRAVGVDQAIQSTALGAVTIPEPKESRKRKPEFNLTERPVKRIASESCSPGTAGGRLGQG